MNPSEPGAAPDAAYQSFLRAGEFRLQQCGGCGRHVFYPRTICPHCGAGELAWTAVSGQGVVYSATIVRQKPERGGDYNLSLVDLDEGVRMMAQVRGVAPEQVPIGLRVRARIAEMDGAHAVVFEPQETAR